ncbi:TraR/DksA family transcriptional regulator [Serratia fonticola]|uniref:TraR/DksA family transcriptional regulator n=1 Tax=Serratia fonticola TaxID=47917 RepID=A0AAJ2D8G8_SERFO|nr:TraR/DksA family transcriptional regulator [Serratia fonticola]MBL5859774.1 TraR/DksA family transcriptional regulator [Serratia fonticola]MBP0997796.1 TraR/DksA family transcriptional regulator [Serratia fonticola]MBP1004630.1 TraR/DksA family transcriptional regulator [Serratia fonticola]MBP1013806.1 TraR/DksA family transcriptional regulator [Serratia fonticola]MDQ9128272.1 TraR/DksA family transcriptional regulator [Serratia fonticola]
MPDLMDLVQQRQEETLAGQINAVRHRGGVSASICEECDQPIPEARRAAFLGVTRCVSCQTLFEQQSKHFRG